MFMSRAALRRRSIPHFVRAMSTRHPELLEIVYLEDMMRMAERDFVAVRLVDLPSQQNGRTLRLAGRVFMQLNRSLSIGDRTVTGMHELCHIWRDELGVAAFYSDDVTGGASCEFADIFAWYVTSLARPFAEPGANQLKLEL